MLLTIDVEKQSYSKNSIYIDMSTIILFSQISINYERILLDREKIACYGRFGIGRTALIVLFDEDQ